MPRHSALLESRYDTDTVDRRSTSTSRRSHRKANGIRARSPRSTSSTDRNRRSQRTRTHRTRRTDQGPNQTGTTRRSKSIPRRSARRMDRARTPRDRATRTGCHRYPKTSAPSQTKTEVQHSTDPGRRTPRPALRLRIHPGLKPRTVCALVAPCPQPACSDIF